MTEFKLIACPDCQKRYRLKSEWIGKTVGCRCGKQFRIGLEMTRDELECSEYAEEEWPAEPFPDDLLWETPAAPLPFVETNTLDDPLAAPENSSVALQNEEASRPNDETLTWRLQCVCVGATFMLLAVANLTLPKWGINVPILTAVGAVSEEFSYLLGFAGLILIVMAQRQYEAKLMSLVYFVPAVLVSTVLFVAVGSYVETLDLGPHDWSGVDMETPIDPRYAEQERQIKFREKHRAKEAEAVRIASESQLRPEAFPIRPTRNVVGGSGFLRKAELPPHLKKTPQIGGSGGSHFLSFDEDSGPVVGFRYSEGNFMGPAIRDFTPIYNVDLPLEVSGKFTLAKPGHAVSGVIIDADDYVRSVKVVFAKLKGEHLDMEDAYQSEWLGTPRNESHRTLGNSGNVVLGIYGGQGLILDSLGLVMAAEK